MKIAKFEFSLFGINTYVVWDPVTKVCAIVDPGMIDDTERNALKRFIERENLKVEHIVNTHMHVDHAIGDNFCVTRWGAPVAASRADNILAERLIEQALAFHLREEVENVSINTFLKDGDTIEIGEGRLHVLAVPGHSPGGIALYDKEDGFVLVGDSLFQGSVGRTDLLGGDFDTLIQAVREKLLTLPDDTVVYPGHGPATTIGRERLTNPYLR